MIGTRHIRITLWSMVGLFLSAGAYFSLAQLTDRSDFVALMGYSTLAFLGYYCLLRQSLPFIVLVVLGIGFRFFFWNSTPILSQDFYRFLWDGQLQILGMNPYANRPNALIGELNFPLFQMLFEGMGELSQQHYSNYPPASQWLFWASALWGGSSLMSQLAVLRSFLMLGDLVALLGLRKILRHYRQPQNLVFLYFLNPLLLLEGVGSLHGEGIMMAAVAWGIWFYLQKNWTMSGGLFALAVALKLLPLLWLPLLLRPMLWKQRALLLGSGVFFSLLFWLPYITIEEMNHFLDSVGLWFSDFEFNASLYYLIREVGYLYKGYNIIHTIGKITPWFLVGMVILFTIWPKLNASDNLWRRAMGLLAIYLATATTVHPWYLIQLVFLSVLTPYRYALVWSLTVLLSYVAYRTESVVEPPWLVWVEYLPVSALLLAETLFNKRFTASSID